jgi:hypothetical protein
MKRPGTLRWYAAAAVVALGVIAAHGEDAVEPQASPVSHTSAIALSKADLEEAFWVCDYVGTTRGLDAAPGELCAALYSELKSTKFGGDFEQLLAWWQQNKAAEHAKLAGRGL